MIETASVRAFLDERHVTLAARVGEFADRQIAPLAEPRDDTAARAQARELVAMLGAAGWFEPIRQQDWRACCLVREALAAASPSRMPCSRSRRWGSCRCCSPPTTRAHALARCRDPGSRDGVVRDDGAECRIGCRGARRHGRPGRRWVRALRHQDIHFRMPGSRTSIRCSPRPIPPSETRASGVSWSRPIRRACGWYVHSCCRHRIRSARSHSSSAGSLGMPARCRGPRRRLQARARDARPRARGRSARAPVAWPLAHCRKRSRIRRRGSNSANGSPTSS
jgi:hypothetical protein